MWTRSLLRDWQLGRKPGHGNDFDFEWLQSMKAKMASVSSKKRPPLLEFSQDSDVEVCDPSVTLGEIRTRRAVRGEGRAMNHQNQ